MLRSHNHLRGFIKLVLWDVYCVSGCGPTSALDRQIATTTEAPTVGHVYLHWKRNKFHYKPV